MTHFRSKIFNYRSGICKLRSVNFWRQRRIARFERFAFHEGNSEKLVKSDPVHVFIRKIWIFEHSICILQITLQTSTDIAWNRTQYTIFIHEIWIFEHGICTLNITAHTSIDITNAIPCIIIDFNCSRAMHCYRNTIIPYSKPEITTRGTSNQMTSCRYTRSGVGRVSSSRVTFVWIKQMTYCVIL